MIGCSRHNCFLIGCSRQNCSLIGCTRQNCFMIGCSRQNCFLISCSRQNCFLIGCSRQNLSLIGCLDANLLSYWLLKEDASTAPWLAVLSLKLFPDWLIAMSQWTPWWAGCSWLAPIIERKWWERGAQQQCTPAGKTVRLWLLFY